MAMSALAYPVPSSRRHVIRVDIVSVDVIRVAFWMWIFIKMVNADSEKNYSVSVTGGTVQRKFKIPIAAIGISTPTSH